MKGACRPSIRLAPDEKGWPHITAQFKGALFESRRSLRHEDLSNSSRTSEGDLSDLQERSQTLPRPQQGTYNRVLT